MQAVFVGRRASLSIALKRSSGMYWKCGMMLYDVVFDKMALVSELVVNLWWYLLWGQMCIPKQRFDTVISAITLPNMHLQPLCTSACFSCLWLRGGFGLKTSYHRKACFASSNHSLHIVISGKECATLVYLELPVLHTIYFERWLAALVIGFLSLRLSASHKRYSSPDQQKKLWARWWMGQTSKPF